MAYAAPQHWYCNNGVFPMDLGNVNNAAAATAALPNITFPAGVCVVVEVVEQTAVTAGTVADTSGNSYSLVSSQALGGSAGILMVFRAYNVAAMTFGTITYTKVASAHNTGLAAFYVANVLTAADPVDSAVTAGGNGTTTTPSLVSGTPSQAGELIVCALGFAATTPSYTQSVGLNTTAPFTFLSNTTASPAGGWMVQPGTATYTYAPTIGTTITGWGAIIIGLKTKAAVGWQNVPFWQASHSYAPGSRVRQFAATTVNNERVFAAYQSAAQNSGSTEPTWPTTKGGTVADGSVTWIEITAQPAVNGDTANALRWTVSSTPPVGLTIYDPVTSSVQVCTVSGAGGTGSAPSFSATAGVATTDASATWISLGLASGFGAWAAPASRATLTCQNASTWGSNSATLNTYLWLGDNHAESRAVALTLAPPVSPTPSQAVLASIDHTASLPVTSAAGLIAGATIATNGNFALNIAGGVNGLIYAFGVNFNSGNQGGGAGVIALGGATDYGVVLENCAVNLYNSNGGSSIKFGNATVGNAIRLKNCTVFPAGGQAINVAGYAKWDGGVYQLGGGVPTAIIGGNFGGGVLECVGVDFSALGSRTLTNIGQQGLRVIFNDCLFGSGAVYAAAATPGWPGGSVQVILSDSAGTTYNQSKIEYEGRLDDTIGIYRAGGASNGVQPYAWTVAPNSNATWWEPFESFPIAEWNVLLSTNRGVAVYGLANAAALPLNDAIWTEAQYKGSAASPSVSFNRGSKSSFVDTGSALAADTTSNWTGGVAARQNSHAYAIGAVIATVGNANLPFFCISGSGNSAASEPGGYATATDGQTVVDGGWTFRAGMRFAMTLTLSSPQPALQGDIIAIVKAAAGGPYTIDPTLSLS